jgi:hypothetical protein
MSGYQEAKTAQKSYSICRLTEVFSAAVSYKLTGKHCELSIWQK